MLDILSKILWWSWNEDAIDLFRQIDAGLWVETGAKPAKVS
jgi:hypothetical protein